LTEKNFRIGATICRIDRITLQGDPYMKLGLKLFAVAVLLAAPMFAVDQRSPMQTRSEFRSQMMRERASLRREMYGIRREALRARMNARVSAMRARVRLRQELRHDLRQFRRSRGWI
jgi:hypothetical protein